MGAEFPSDHALVPTSYTHTALLKASGATHDIHLAVEGTRCRAVVIRNKRIGSQ